MQLKVGNRTTCGRGIIVFADEQDIAIQWWGITTHGSFTSWYTPDEIVKYGLAFVCETAGGSGTSIWHCERSSECIGRG